MTDYQGRSGEALAEDQSVAYANSMYPGSADLDHESDDWMYWARCLEDFTAGQKQGEAETVAQIVAWLRECDDLSLRECTHYADAIERGDWKQP